MIVSAERKPRCRLPQVLTVSYLIGNVVTALREAGREDLILDFTRLVKESNMDLDYYSIICLASEYVEFYE